MSHISGDRAELISQNQPSGTWMTTGTPAASTPDGDCLSYTSPAKGWKRCIAQLQVELNREQLAALQRYAWENRVAFEQLIREYDDYLLAGGPPVLFEVIAYH